MLGFAGVDPEVGWGVSDSYLGGLKIANINCNWAMDLQYSNLSTSVIL